MNERFKNYLSYVNELSKCYKILAVTKDKNEFIETSERICELQGYLLEYNKAYYDEWFGENE